MSKVGRNSLPKHEFRRDFGVNSNTYFCIFGRVHFTSIIIFYLFFETKGQQASAKAQEAVHHLASFPSSREEISQSGLHIKIQRLPTSFYQSFVQTMYFIFEGHALASYKYTRIYSSSQHALKNKSIRFLAVLIPKVF